VNTPAPPLRRAVIFDIGGVLLDWNPRHLYRKLIADEAAMEDFLARVCTQEWNERQDAGRPFAEAVALLQAQHPDHAPLIAAFHERWPEMVSGAIEGTVAIMAELRARGTPIYAVTNFSAEKFSLARERFDFLTWFREVVVSGEVGVIKPDRRIFEILFERSGLTPAEAIYIDDVPKNVASAATVGLEALHFTDAPALRRDLVRLGFLE
jgi:2-haloacid dehalogenase